MRSQEGLLFAIANAPSMCCNCTMSKPAAAVKVARTSRGTSAARGLMLPNTGKFVVPGHESIGKVAVKVPKSTVTVEAELYKAIAKGATAVWDSLIKHLRVDEQVSITPVLARNLLDIGMPARLVSDLTETLGVSASELSYLMDIDRSTVTRLKQNDKPVPMHSAESILRLVEVKQLATEVFGSAEKASKWLNKPHPMFGSRPPLGEVRSSYGAQHVKDVLLATKYGGVV